MVKTVFYLGLTAFGIVASLFSPLIGAITCIEAYLFNPSAILMSGNGFRFQFWATIAFLGGLLLTRPRPVPRIGREGLILLFLWMFVGMCYLSSTWAVISSPDAVDGAYDILKTMVVVSALIWSIRSEADASTLITALVVGVLHAAFLHTFGPRLGYVSYSVNRDEGVLTEGQSQVMVIFVPLLILLVMRGTKWQRLLSLVTIPFTLDSIINTYQRATFVALLFEGLLLLLFLPKRIVLRALPVICVAMLLFIFRFAPPDYWSKMRTIQDPHSEGSAESRFVLAEVSWHMFQDHPFGVGYKNYQYVSPQYLDATYLTEGRRSSHNSYFAVLCDLGVAGLLPWLAAIGVTLVMLRRMRREVRTTTPPAIYIYAMAIEIGLYGWIVTGLFDDESGLDPPYWLITIAIVLYRLRRRVVVADPKAFPEGNDGMASCTVALSAG